MVQAASVARGNGVARAGGTARDDFANRAFLLVERDTALLDSSPLRHQN